MAGWSLIRFAALFGIIMVAANASAAHAQDENCRFFRVQSENLNIFKEPRGGADFIDALDRNDVVCVTRDQQVGDDVWAYISYKLEKHDQHASVRGWTIMRLLRPATPEEVAVFRGEPRYDLPGGGEPRHEAAAPPIERGRDGDCRFFRVQTESLNITKEPRPNADFIDALDRNDIVCVTRDERVGDGAWAFISYKLEKRSQRAPVEGWATMRDLVTASADEIAALQGGREPEEPGRAETSPPVRSMPEPAPPPAAAATPPALSAPASAPPAAGIAAAPPSSPEPGQQRTTDAGAAGENVPTYSEPIKSGPPPVYGHSLEELMHGIPLFSPIDGLPENEWKKNCESCHQWNRQTLCQQGQVYIKDPRAELRIQHPYGGPEKVAIMKWAKAGCQ